MTSQNLLPPLGEGELVIAGSHYRGTDLAPLWNVDIFLLLDSSLVDIHQKGNTLNIVTQNQLLSTCIDESLHLLPHKLVSTLESLFSQKFPTKMSNSGQALKLQVERHSLEVRITPAFAWDHSYFIPQEKSELLWRRVSPFHEKERLDKINAMHNGFVIPAIRYLKRWNEVRNNEGFRNYHVEAIAYFIFEEIPTPAKSVMEALRLYAAQMSKYIYSCPDPTGLDAPINIYLPDNIDQWYLFMNRIGDLKTAISSGEKAVVDLVKKTPAA